ncbi:hypothetical protein DFH07DRAFT_776017 [Mycena maculata]|uniref:Uncharacterized protein n=1 Tax=Mycena maculata TaxID=230809 RepID=A0AAD7INX2_9AGAR|nr:hypothetical protein DFH07DRAFT_776017 [Mycena maculata]
MASLIPSLPTLTHLCLCAFVAEQTLSQLFLDCRALQILVPLFLDAEDGHFQAHSPPAFPDMWSANTGGSETSQHWDFISQKRSGVIPYGRYWMDYWIADEKNYCSSGVLIPALVPCLGVIASRQYTSSFHFNPTGIVISSRQNTQAQIEHQFQTAIRCTLILPLA